MTRRYDMARRSQQAAQTRENIIAATEALLRTRRIDEVTLQAIAEEAATTVQTVLRHMESRDGCFTAVVQVVTTRVATQRGRSAYCSVEDAIADLTDHYEAEGPLILNLLAQEQSGDAFVTDLMKRGRRFHRDWVRRCITGKPDVQTQSDIDALVLATDIYAWKLLRLDLGRSRTKVREVMSRIVKGVLDNA
ncbi:MAG: TetR family transcriptional regulator [Bacteroidota bacterium]|nr:TetR family transcriptional regulator [Bacteroidota bacterium]